MGWEIRANRGKHVRAGVDARGWLWEITRGALKVLDQDEPPGVIHCGSEGCSYLSP
jgi:hypothetical protein